MASEVDGECGDGEGSAGMEKGRSHATVSVEVRRWSCCRWGVRLMVSAGMEKGRSHATVPVEVR